MDDDAFDAYIASLDVSDVARERIAEVVSAFEFLAGAPLERVFLADLVDEHGERHWDAVWGFAAGSWMQARNFLRQFDLDISPYSNAVEYLGMQHEGIDWGEDGEPVITPASRVSIEARTARVHYSQMSATGTNCAVLLGIVKELLLPNLMR